ncbi:MAG: ABC transporter substrate-binding protein [Phascolarctobacterium sp.]|nr:ABC transporter substrate-binding protein [Phascolarctobacterium sp.]
MEKKVKILAALVLSASVLFAGCGGSKDGGAKATDKNTINISLHQYPPKLDPRISSAFVERHVFQSLFDKLVDLDGKGNIAPMLAEKWEISPDGMKYTFHLRKGIKFHDGTEFNAETVKFNLDDYKLKGSNRANELKNIASVKVVDAYTVELTMKKPYAPLLSILADRAGMMRSPAAVKKLGDKFMNSPVGSGPYKFKERIKGNKIVLVKNADYWKSGSPKAETLVYKIIDDANVALVNLKSGQLDMTNRFPLNEAGNFKDNKALSVCNEAGPGFKGYVLNTTNNKFKDKRVRQAMEKVIDRNALVKVALFGVGTPGRTALSPTSFAYDAELDKPQKPDIEGAKKLMAEAGMSKGFKFTLLTDTDPVSAQVAQQTQNMLKAINIEMVIEKQDFGTMLDRAKKGNYEAAGISWSGRVDPDGNIYDWLYTGSYMNYMRYSSTTMDKLLDEARMTVDNDKRKSLYKEIMALALEDSPYIYLYHENNVFGISNEVKGFVPNPDGMIRTVDMTKK